MCPGRSLSAFATAVDTASPRWRGKRRRTLRAALLCPRRAAEDVNGACSELLSNVDQHMVMLVGVGHRRKPSQERLDNGQVLPALSVCFEIGTPEARSEFQGDRRWYVQQPAMSCI